MTDTDSTGAPDYLEAFIAANNVILPLRQLVDDYDGDGMSDAGKDQESMREN